MSIYLILFALILVGVIALAFGLRQVVGAAAQRRALLSGIEAAGEGELIESPIKRWNAAFIKTRLGQRIQTQLVQAGEEDKPALIVSLLAVFGGAAVAYVMWVGLAPAFSLLGVVAIVVGLRAYITSAKNRRREAFIGQMPELARVLSNGTNAGLSIATAVALASEELAEPAGTEMARVARQLKFGASLQESLSDLEERLPSREVAVLVSTLLVSARSGGSLVTALRDIADTLEARKEVRREIRTTLAQSTATGYLVIVLGFSLLFLLNLIQPGTVGKMTTSLAGQIALVVAGTLFVGGFLAIKKMTKFDG